MLEQIKKVGIIGFVQNLFPEAGKDVILAIVAWMAYWAVRIARTLLKQEWPLQGVIKRNLAIPLTQGIALDILWEVLNTDHARRAPIYLNWVPVAWRLAPWGWVRPLCVLIILFTFGDVIIARVKGLLGGGKLGLLASLFKGRGGGGPTNPF